MTTPLVHGVHPPGAQNVGTLVHSVHPPGAHCAPDSKAFDSKPDSKAIEIQHGDAALNAMPAWGAFKEQLQTELPAEEFNLWARPMMLLKVMPVDAERKHLLAAIPPNGRIRSAAQERLPMMRELLAPVGMNISLTLYPDEWEIQEAKNRYGIDMAPKPWTRGAARKEQQNANYGRT